MEDVTPKPIKTPIDTSRRSQTISDKVGGMLVTQIANEIHNHNAYRTFQNYYARRGYDELAKYYKKRALEELEHQTWILDYLNDCDLPYQYTTVKPVEYEINDDTDPLKITVDLEIETTIGIYSIVDQITEEGDWETFEWIQRTLVAEQHEEESTSRTALDIGNSDADWLYKSHKILKLLK